MQQHHEAHAGSSHSWTALVISQFFSQWFPSSPDLCFIFRCSLSSKLRSAPSSPPHFCFPSPATRRVCTPFEYQATSLFLQNIILLNSVPTMICSQHIMLHLKISKVTLTMGFVNSFLFNGSYWSGEGWGHNKVGEKPEKANWSRSS